MKRARRARRAPQLPQGKYKLVIVESPAKAKTLSKYFGSGYLVAASMGHVVDLPKRGLGVDLQSFEANYQVIPSKRKIVQRLKALASKAEEVLLATDPDREGEAIAYHISRLLNLRAPKRLELREITPRGVREALSKPRPIDLGLVTAQHTRRILDRLMGYTLSPLLWRALKRTALSAGRVQSVALKLICEREREILSFTPEPYYILQLTFQLGDEEIRAYLMSGSEPMRFKERDEELERALRSARWRLEISYEDKEVLPPPPLITSTLQAECSKLGISAGRTMRIAQELFEGVDTPEGRRGLITYHRTDSIRVSPAGVKLAEEILSFTYGDEWFVRRNYKPKSNAQDAHEAIRPTAAVPPDSLRGVLSTTHLKVYQVIWSRFLAAFSPSFTYKLQKLTFVPDLQLKGEVSYKAAKPIRMGFADIIGMPSVDELKNRWVELPEGVFPELKGVRWLKRETKPPKRYTQATLIKTLERLGVGRPSTYAQTIETLLKRGYAVMRGKQMVPTELGFQVNDYLQRYFPDMINERFTASMEAGLDEIESRGERESGELSKRYLREFWRKLSEEVSRARGGE